MDISNKKYNEMVKKASPPSPVLKNCLWAFSVGGAICCLGELLFKLYGMFGMDNVETRTMVSVTLIVIAAILTGIGIFDKIAKRAGAGTVVPITGFANSISSQAIDSKSEGFIGGVGAKIFTIAGPVILYGLLAGAIYGIILYIASLFGG
jgi:stage V sporulation protein AC